MSPQQATILRVLEANKGKWVKGETLNNVFHIFAYSQRIGELKRLGHEIETDRHSKVARYRLVTP